MRDEGGSKYLRVERVIELLSTLAPDARVMPNDVGNLLIADPPGENYLAYLEFSGQGSLESMTYTEGDEP